MDPSSSPARRNSAEARSADPRPRRKRSNAIAIASTRRAQFRACLRRSRSPNSTNRPAAPSKPTLSSRRARRLFADARNARDRRGAGAAGGARGDGRGQGRAAQRQRLTQLHVSYGNALIAARGYGAPETTEAFARARESARRQGRAGALGGRLRPMGRQLRARRAASDEGALAAFLSDVEARPDSPEAGVAHRAAGITCWFAGEYR